MAPGGWARRLGAAALATLFGLLAAVVPAAPAAAHAVLLGSDPVDGAVLASAPSEVTLTFNEPVMVRPDGVRLLDAAGAELSTDSRSVDTTVVLTVPPDLVDGTYIVAFRVVSADSHPISGGFSFVVGTPSSAAVVVPESRPSSALNLLRQAAEAVAYLGLLVSAGLLVFLLVLLRAEAPVLRRRLLRLAGWSAGLTVLARLVLVPAVPAWQDGRGLTGLIDGAQWLTGLRSEEALSSVLVVLGLSAGLWACWSAVGGRSARRAALSALAFAGIALAWGAVALVGHTRTYGPAWLVVPADVLHVTTAGVWLGGLVALPWALSRSADLGADAAARTVSAFSRTAAVLVGLLAAAGLLLAWRILRSWEALWATSYGVALLTKVGLTLVVLVVAAHNRFRLVPRVRTADRDDNSAQAWRLLRRTVRVEAALLVGVVVATGFLVTQSPVVREAAPRPTADAGGGPIVVEAPLGPGRAVARFTPGEVGVNSMELELVDAAGQPVVPVADPKLTILLPAMDIGPLERSLAPTGPGRYEAVVDLPLAGAWVVQANVRTSKYDSPTARFTVEVR
ncbi:transport integral membrane protein [Micromonospora lutea]|uniref:Transport integral membrane protein n=1 Tax=Micromonospora lutea TaxID=419825 RepID=A0ABQ4J231_9ACTN|nr:transport integral membrane protein [Micromonospora lutea]